MGHTRLGKIPTSRKWNAVVAQVVNLPEGEQVGDHVGQIASLTLDAASGALKMASQDPIVRFTFFLLTQLALSGKSEQAQETLRSYGIDCNTIGSAAELGVQFQRALDNYQRQQGKKTDFSEMARQAAGSTLASTFQSQQLNLFGHDSDSMKNALRSISTPKQFGEIGQTYFGNFMSRYLNFYLSRITAKYAGEAGIPQVGAITGFNDALETHCRQSALILKKFSGEWFSKTEFKSGIDLRNSSGFVRQAFRKLESEILRQRGEDE